ncbi:MAG: glycerophosphodiester phosphodiesterase family protein [Phycisphaerae bacterium]|nr:glycerophosphodiester phosphodiesterase family protein [Phycisphaerae bacterium]
MTKCFSVIRAAVHCVVVLSFPVFAAMAQPQSGELHTVDAGTAQGLQGLFAPNGDALPLVSAHRGGAAKDFPENCIATFEQTLRHAWSMLEIDLRYTKDGVLVLNHDPTLDRTTSGTGRVEDHTLQALKQLQLKDRQGTLTKHRITTLDEALAWARGKTILILDKKEVPVKDVVRKIEAFHAEAYAMVMAYSFEDIKACHALNKNIMMEIMVGNNERFDAFEKTGVPWRNVIAFVGHTPPQDDGLCERIHAKGASCMAGSSRNIDRQFLSKQAGLEAIKPDYRALLGLGVDVIETDIPREVGPLLYGGHPIPASKAKYFRTGLLQKAL